MARHHWQEQVACPHCGRLVRKGSSSVAHARCCLKDPAVFNATKAALDDGDGCIRSMASMTPTGAVGCRVSLC